MKFTMIAVVAAALLGAAPATAYAPTLDERVVALETRVAELETSLESVLGYVRHIHWCWQGRLAVRVRLNRRLVFTRDRGHAYLPTIRRACFPEGRAANG